MRGLWTPGKNTEEQPATEQIITKQAKAGNTRPEVDYARTMSGRSLMDSKRVNTRNIEDEEVVRLQKKTVRMSKYIFNSSNPKSTYMICKLVIFSCTFT